MARKPATRAEFILFDVVYEDGSQRSNRRVPSELLGGLDGDVPARAVIEEQDRLIAQKSGTPALAVKSLHRSGSKKEETTVTPPAFNRCNVATSAASPLASRLEFGSSSTTSRGSPKTARARPIRPRQANGSSFSGNE